MNSGIIVIETELPIKVLALAINATYPILLFDGTIEPSDQLSGYLKVIKKTPIRFYSLDDCLQSRVAVRAELTIQPIRNGLLKWMGEVSQLDSMSVDLDISTLTKLSVSDEGKLDAHTTASFEWENRPTLAGISLPLRTILTPFLETNLQQVAAQIDEQIEFMSQSATVEEAWKTVQKVTQIGTDPPTWSQIVLAEPLYVSPIAFHEGELKLRVGTVAEMEVSVGMPMPTEPAISLPQLERKALPNHFESGKITLMLAWNWLEQETKRNVALAYPDAWPDPIDLSELSLEPGPGETGFLVQLSLKTKYRLGRVKIPVRMQGDGIVHLNPKGQRLEVEFEDLSLQGGNFAARFGWMAAKKRLTKVMKETFQKLLDDLIEQEIRKAREQVANMEFPHAMSVHVQLDDFQFGEVTFPAACLKVELFVDGDMKLMIQGLPA
ncbi:DUF4403 family protein [Pontibacter sp. G13]|uniref:DUF4403 family protein n=1 Tax=Pontibacter sp. G13 TaxID=3074898 RepID=UPI00288974C6|nr:DUF4403 family protein [Pontibacter sp. G13]WNJ21128.1 DUF4403 family protein [Pontibacter sp. G13]